MRVKVRGWTAGERKELAVEIIRRFRKIEADEQHARKHLHWAAPCFEGFRGERSELRQAAAVLGQDPRWLENNRSQFIAIGLIEWTA